LIQGTLTTSAVTNAAAISHNFNDDNNDDDDVMVVVVTILFEGALGTFLQMQASFLCCNVIVG
jgi:hypothetical protein